LNKLTDLLRLELSQIGYTEGLTFTLCSKEDVSDKLRKRLDQIPAVHISNPKTMDFQVVRTTLLCGLLKTLASSKNMPLPLKIFEVSDVVLNDSTTEVGARNERRLCVVYYNKHSGFEIVHGVLDRLMQVLGIPCKSGYHLEHTEDSTFMPGRCASIILTSPSSMGQQSIGKIGVLHPEVVHQYELNLPCCALEINIEHFV
jgi:phenylalanyl-tRNA synthetase beta chain